MASIPKFDIIELDSPSIFVADLRLLPQPHEEINVSYILAKMTSGSGSQEMILAATGTISVNGSNYIGPISIT